MLIRKAPDLTYADVTPKSAYADRRKFLRAMGIVGATAVTAKGLFDLAFNSLIKLVEPTSKAQFVAFQSYYDPRQMPLGRWAGIEFPYVEGLRLDEAMNPLTLLCVGMYGESLPNQDGAPVRMVIPWKYGFKRDRKSTRLNSSHLGISY